MRYWGKLLGLALGIASSVGIWGVIMGLLMGHWIDRVQASRRRDYFSAQSTRQSLFFLTTFQAMGHLTKSKGRVTEADIKIATKMMDRLELFGEARTAAQRAFREGKAGHFPLRIKLRKLRDACLGRFDLIKMFLEIQLQVAFVDGVLHPNERRVLYVIADELGVTREQFEFFLRNMESPTGQQSRQNQSRQNGKSHQRRSSSYSNGGYSGGHSYGGQRPASVPCGPTVESACRTLGVRSSDDAATIKRAYRKLMSEHHPDKLVAKKLSPRMMEMAKRKAQDIQAAYELLKGANRAK
ncbi:co-chaperone DjlA [Pectobacterium parmentieri]|uniref:Co-chaperone protein DjlA n=1 Tax=Pectobacterium parmentieri TaxID=1905730 RepID=A0A0H3I7S8_PECPM|nr:co-chaperone DjlA [Pectobacterium parmentieri]ACX89562.1 heat shock protein DnaJ domain protein [Pectobacterium parmentieri WPP163]AFI92040.1 DnaJ-like protein djlA [Pectobacterium parmentieri]AOR61598.1 molecular chaperone DjlA [Pectobacterium parmentieri]AYH02960.1 co-chaperone DjlA [Pectobacterium parmentieri]AYH07222.1 co-chaperone DjlA [Pectobacterium parmentieri]